MGADRSGVGPRSWFAETTRRERVAWFGSLYWWTFVRDLGPEPLITPAGPLWPTFYPCFGAALVLLSMRSIAEAVEDGDVLGRPREYGCDLAQRYGIARPQDAAATTAGLLEWEIAHPAAVRAGQVRSV